MATSSTARMKWKSATLADSDRQKGVALELDLPGRETPRPYGHTL